MKTDILNVWFERKVTFSATRLEGVDVTLTLVS